MTRKLRKLGRALRMLRLYRNWLCAYRNRLDSSSEGGEVVYRLRSGPVFSMEAGPHDIRVLNEVWLDRIYEQQDDFRVQGGWTVVDLGAHKGAFTIRAALSGPSTEVHAVEPAPDNIAGLRRNIELNGLANVHVHEEAVGSSRGRALLTFDTADSGRSSLVVERGHSARIPVSTVPLADLLAGIGEVDLLKMDVEGAEHDVLHTVPTTVISIVHRIVLEYHGTVDSTAEAACASLRSLLEGHGFRCVEARDRSLLFATRKSRER